MTIIRRRSRRPKLFHKIEIFSTIYCTALKAVVMSCCAPQGTQTRGRKLRFSVPRRETRKGLPIGPQGPKKKGLRAEKFAVPFLFLFLRKCGKVLGLYGVLGFRLCGAFWVPVSRAAPFLRNKTYGSRCLQTRRLEASLSALGNSLQTARLEAATFPHFTHFFHNLLHGGKSCSNVFMCFERSAKAAVNFG